MAGKTTEAAMHVTLSGGKTLLAATHGVTKWREKPFAQNPREIAGYTCMYVTSSIPAFRLAAMGMKW